MYNVLLQKTSITKYNDELAFLTFLGYAKSEEELPGNANLRSERIKSDLVHCIGEFSGGREYL